MLLSKIAPLHGFDVELRRENDTSLLIDIKGCETLVFQFKNAKKTEEYDEHDALLWIRKGWGTQDRTCCFGPNKLYAGYEVENYPQNEIFYCSGFSKTQFSGNVLKHVFYAEILRVLCATARYAEVSDEGEYYHTLEVEDAEFATNENAALIRKTIDALKASGWKDENIVSRI